MLDMIFDSHTLELLRRDILLVMTDGQPPIYVQLIAVTAAFILFRLWRSLGRRRDPHARLSGLQQMAPSIIYVATLIFLANGGLEKSIAMLHIDTWRWIVLEFFGRA